MLMVAVVSEWESSIGDVKQRAGLLAISIDMPGSLRVVLLHPIQ